VKVEGFVSKWFISEHDEVRGPFSAEQIQAQVDAKLLSPKALLWTKGLDGWQDAQLWNTRLKNQALTPEQMEQKRQWHYAIDGEAYGPVPYPQLIIDLQRLEDRAAEAQVWTKGMSAWASIFEFHRILDELKINRRQSPRASLDGQVVIQVGDQQMIGTLKSISQGGFGADRIQGLLPGQQIQAEIRAKALHENFQVRAEVRYLEESGYAGFLFTSINREATAAIIQLMKTQSKMAA
jgi:hypothetical protein